MARQKEDDHEYLRKRVRIMKKFIEDRRIDQNNPNPYIIVLCGDRKQCLDVERELIQNGYDDDNYPLQVYDAKHRDVMKSRLQYGNRWRILLIDFCDTWSNRTLQTIGFKGDFVIKFNNGNRWGQSSANMRHIINLMKQSGALLNFPVFIEWKKYDLTYVILMLYYAKGQGSRISILWGGMCGLYIHEDVAMLIGCYLQDDFLRYKSTKQLISERKAEGKLCINFI